MSSNRINILNVVGARPNFMKLAPVLKEYNKHRNKITPTLIHTGQHYDAAMSGHFISDLGISKPDIELGVGSGSHAIQTAKVMIGFEEQLLKLQPDLVVVVGDVNSTMACAIVAAKCKVPLAHIEAGLRSFDRSMPEEINRIITDRVSDLLFTTTEEATDNLIREGISSEKIFFVGNTMIDSLISLEPTFKAVDARARYGLAEHPFAFITLHRPSNVDSNATLLRICGALQSIQERIRLFWPLHPRTKNKLLEFGLMKLIEEMDNLVVSGPLGYVESMSVMASASLVLTDSGGIQEETTMLGIPCLTLRENTERAVTITEGTNELVGTDPVIIVQRVLAILESGGKKGRTPRLWDGKAAERIVDVILGQYQNP